MDEKEDRSENFETFRVSYQQVFNNLLTSTTDKVCS